MKARVEKAPKGTVYYYIVTIVDGYADESMVDVYGDPDNGRTLLYKTHEEAINNLEIAVKHTASTMGNGLEVTDIKKNLGDVITGKLMSGDWWAGDIQACIAEAVVM
jgi:hypothetical protein